MPGLNPTPGVPAAMAAVMAPAEQPHDAQVLVRFVTKLPLELRVPETQVAVPSSLRRYGLSQIINHLLALDPARPFDFLIDGELLRKDLGQHLLDHGISPESVVQVEYVPAVVPPEARLYQQHDDWVSAVAACAERARLASGSYDGVLRLWDRAGACTCAVPAHAGGVTAAAWLPEAQGPLLLSAGKDAALRLWRVQGGGGAKGVRGGGGGGGELEAVAVCAGHSDTVAALAVSPGGDVAASGGWDGKLLLWDTGAAVADEAAAAAAGGSGGGGGGDDGPGGGGEQQSKKKRRTARGAAAAARALHRQAPRGSLEGHVHCVSALCWGGGRSGLLASGGWDHSVRLWDVGAGRCVATHNGSKAVYAVAAAPGGSGGLIAFGGADSALRLWDARARGEAVSTKGYAAGDSWVAALAWRPHCGGGGEGGGSSGSEHHVASVSQDGALRLWDVRTPVPLATLRQHTDKGLALGWWGPGSLVSGGADCKLVVYDLPEAGAGGGGDSGQ